MCLLLGVFDLGGFGAAVLCADMIPVLIRRQIFHKLRFAVENSFVLPHGIFRHTGRPVAKIQQEQHKPNDGCHNACDHQRFFPIPSEAGAMESVCPRGGSAANGWGVVFFIYRSTDILVQIVHRNTLFQRIVETNVIPGQAIRKSAVLDPCWLE